MNTPTPRGFLPTLGLALTLLVAPAALAPGETADDVPGLEGSWTWTWKDRDGRTHRHVMEVEGKGAKLAAREIFDDQQPVRVDGLMVDGRSVRFSVVRGERRSDYKGKIAAPDQVNGTVTVTAAGQTEEFVWKAERNKPVPK